LTSTRVRRSELRDTKLTRRSITTDNQWERILDVVQIVVGWILGFVTPTVLERFTRLRRQRQLKGAIGVELRELQFTMATVALRLFRRTKSISPDRILLMREIVDSYRGPEEDPEGLKATRRYLSLPYAQQAAIVAQAQETTVNSPRLVKYHLPFLEAHLPDVRELPLDLQQRLTQVLQDLRLYNDAADYCASQLDRTFDASITGVNRVALNNNIEETYRLASNRSERIMKEIREVLARYALGP
jgi:hypothetical protein